MNWRWPLKIDADYPGVRTTVKQTVDFKSLDDAQVRRLVRAVERGHMTRTGYIQGLVKAAAKHLGVTPPVTVSGTSVYPLPKDRWEKPLADLLNLSKVRWQMQKAAAADNTTSWRWRQEPGWDQWSHDSCTFRGWEGDEAALREKVTAVLKAHGYHDDLRKLAEFIKSRPEFEV